MSKENSVFTDALVKQARDNVEAYRISVSLTERLADHIEQLAATNEELERMLGLADDQRREWERHCKKAEAKLAKAVEALREISSKSMGEDGCYYTNRVNIARARTTLAELKGQDDE